MEYDEINDTYRYHTGIALESPDDYSVLLFPRSSNLKTDLYMPNSVGIADTAIYRGEIIFCYKSRISTYERSSIVGLKAYMQAKLNCKTEQEAEQASSEARVRIMEMTRNLEFAPYKPGDRIGQMVIVKRLKMNFLPVEELSESDRGTGGFGSSGS